MSICLLTFHYVRLEVGPARRRHVAETIYLDKHGLIIDQLRVIDAAHRWAVPPLNGRIHLSFGLDKGH